MRTHISADFGRFLFAGIVNTALTSAIYFLGLLVLDPAYSYAFAWVVGLVFVMWFYPDRVFIDSNAGTIKRIALGLIIAVVFFAGWAVLQLVLSITERPDIAFVVALTTTVFLNFVLGRLLLRSDNLSALWIERIASTIFLALPIACLFWMSVQWLKHGIDLPYYDDWRGYVYGNLESLNPGHLFRPANDTLFAVGKALDAFASRVLNGNSVAYQLLSMTFVLGSLLALQWHLLKAAFTDRLLCAAAFSLTILMIQPGSYWGVQNIAYHQALPIVCILASIYVATLAKWHWAVRTSILLTLGLISGLSYISGAFAFLAVALTLSGCIAINRRAFLPLVPDAGAMLLAGVVTTAIQLWVILFYQKGNIHTGTAWALPTELDFWLYLFGKMGRSLMLPTSMPLISLIIVGTSFAIAISIAAISIYKVAVAQGRNDGLTRASLVTLLLLAAVFCYLFIVAAGRTNLRGTSIQTPLQIFSFGFHRFHFFWATVIWPWVFVGVFQYWPFKRSFWKRLTFAVAAGAIVIFAAAQGVFSHNSSFRFLAARANENAECLRQKLMEGLPIYCPRLYPHDLSKAYVNAVEMDASFVRYFPPSLIGMPEKRFDVLKSEPALSVNNASTSINDSGELKISAGHDVQIVFSVDEFPQDCLAIRVEAEVVADERAMSQFFYHSARQKTFSETRSQKRHLFPDSSEPLEFVITSPDGFGNTFRLNSTASPRATTVRSLEIACVLHSS